jgi:hypothetical protein
MGPDEAVAVVAEASGEVHSSHQILASSQSISTRNSQSSRTAPKLLKINDRLPFYPEHRVTYFRRQFRAEEGCGKGLSSVRARLQPCRTDKILRATLAAEEQDFNFRRMPTAANFKYELYSNHTA